MKTAGSVSASVAASIALWVGLGSTAPAGAQSERRETARAELAKAIARAKSWKADAQLVSIVGQSVDAAGRADNNSRDEFGGWQYVFHSPSAKAGTGIGLYAGGLTAMPDFVGASFDIQVTARGQQPLPATFLDSDKAAAAAIAAGLDTKKGPMQMFVESLKGLPEDSLRWNLTTGGDTYVVSATSGKFLLRIPAGL